MGRGRSGRVEVEHGRAAAVERHCRRGDFYFLFFKQSRPCNHIVRLINHFFGVSIYIYIYISCQHCTHSAVGFVDLAILLLKR